MLFKFVFLCLCASRERYFRNNGWTRSKVEKRKQGLQLGNPRICPIRSYKKLMVREEQFEQFEFALVADSI